MLLYTSKIYQTYITFQHRNISNLLCIVIIAILSQLSHAAITVNGLTSQTVYSDSVSFTIDIESGFTYQGLLNSEPINLDSPITIDQPDYYELEISKTNSSTNSTENLFVQFIVRDSNRYNTEWGLPTWTPYPMINSAPSEFSDSTLKIITPSIFPSGLEIPVIAWISDSTGKRTGVNGQIELTNYPDTPLQLYRGVGSALLPAGNEYGTVSLTANIANLETYKTIEIETTTNWQEISGTINTDTNWNNNARIKITNDLTIASDTILTIGSGCIIIVSPEVSIAVQGHIIINGTDTNPTVFTPEDKNMPWGGFLFESADCSGNINGTIFTGSGADENWFDTHKTGDFTHKDQQCLFYLSNGSQLNLNNCYIIDNNGQLGHGESSYLNMTNCLVQKCVTCGQFNQGELTFENCALIEFPGDRTEFADADNDVIYLNGGPHTFINCLMGWTLDDGIDAGEGATGEVIIDGCWFESCIHEAMAWSCGSGYERYATISNSVVTNCGQAIECGYNTPRITATNTLCTANVTGARFGDNYDRSYTGSLTVSDSILIFNYRDIMNRNWTDWQEHLTQTDIQNNLVSKEYNNYPNNTLWAPQTNPEQLNRLSYFSPSAGNTVGIGIATESSRQNLADGVLKYKIPVRLSKFTASNVMIDFTVHTNSNSILSDTLSFVPGETLKFIEFQLPNLEGIRQIRITLSNPVNAVITNHSQIIIEKPYILTSQIISEGDQCRYFKGQSEPDTGWNQLNFSENSSWHTGSTPIGYDTDSSNGNTECIATYLSDMRGNYYSVYTRNSFMINDPARITKLSLLMKWDDGYIAYINGLEVDSQSPPATVAHNQPASTSNHEAHCDGNYTEVDISDYISALLPGENVLAIQIHNTTINSSDLFLSPKLIVIQTPLPGDIEPNGAININDLSALAYAWLSKINTPEYDSILDINDSPDGSIDMLDFAVFAHQWLYGSESE